MNPFNDHAGWQVATGRAVPAEPLLGLGAAVRAFFDRDRESRHRPTTTAPAAPHKGCVHTIGLIGTGGILLVQPWRSR